MTSRSTRTCPICGTEYVPYRDYQKACSRNCRSKLPETRERTRAYFAREDVKERKNAVRRVTVNPDRRAVNLRANLRRYGITPERYAEMLAEQNGVCLLCGLPPAGEGHGTSSRLHVDHDHVTGKVRGLLCNNCNRGLGYLADDPVLMLKAAEYVKRNRP